MDPFSLCANVISVLQATHDVIQICYDFRAALQDSPWALTRVLDVATDLRAVLERLERVADEDIKRGGQHGGIKRNLQLLCTPSNGPLARCLNELEDLRTRLEPSRLAGPSGTRRHALMESLTWRLKERDVKTNLDRIEKCKATLQLALTADEMTLLMHIDQVSVSMQETLSAVGSSLDNMLSRMDAKEQAELNGKTRKLVNWLCPVDPAELHENRLKVHVPGTGKWILATKQYEDWSSREQNVLWLTGPPGAGKTQIFSEVVSNVQASAAEHNAHLLAYFYCDFRRKELCDPRIVAGSLTAQLCSQTNMFPAALKEAFESSSLSGQRARPTFDLLKNAISSFGRDQKVTLMIDAVDECDKRSDILSFVLSLVGSEISVSILLSSRDEIDIKTALIDHDQLRTENHLREMNADIQLYTDLRLQMDTRLNQLQANIKSEISQSLADRATGMFRWVELQLTAISSLQTVKQIRRSLSELPEGLDKTYGAILQKIPRRNTGLVRQILLWLAFSVIPLSLEETQEAIAIELDAETLDDENRLSHPEDIFLLCRSLVSMSEKGYLSLAHLSVRDYLLSNEITRDSLVSTYAIAKDEANLGLASACLTYLNFAEFATGPCATAEAFADRIKRFSLARHASLAWPYYVQACSCPTTLRDRILRFFRPENRNVFMSWVQILNADVGFKWNLYPTHATSLYYAASFGLDNIVKVLVEEGAILDAPGSRFGGTALHGATLRGHKAAMLALLDAGADPNRADFNRVTPVHTAAAIGLVEIVQILVDHGASLEARDEGGETPLDWARQAGELPLATLHTLRASPPSRQCSSSSPTSPNEPPQVWTRQRAYFPEFYEKRSGINSSIILSVEFVPKKAQQSPANHATHSLSDGGEK